MDDPSPDDGVAAAKAAMRAANRRADYGRRRPGEYTNWIDEQLSWKETCYIGDWTFLANCWLDGPDAEALLADLSINSFSDYPVGAGKHLVQCNEDGKVIGEGVLLKHGEEAFEVHGVPAYWTAYNLGQGDYDATAEFRDTFNYGVQGPNSLKVLEKVSEGPLRETEFMHWAELEIAGQPVNAVRFGMSGELGFELQGVGDGGAVWGAVLEAGQEFGIRRLSVKTSSINQLESGIASRVRDYVSAIYEDDMQGYRDYLRETATRDLITHPVEGSFDGDDITDWYRSPVELGWGRYMRFDHDFVGREALEEEAAGPDRTLVTLEWDDEDVVDCYASLFRDGRTFKYMDMPHQQKRAMVADRVLADGREVGVATMRGYSYYFRQMLSLCVIDPDYAEPGTEVTVLWGEGPTPTSPTVEDHDQKEVRATVAATPYKEDRRRAALDDDSSR